jgi:type I restriction enzyme S subunit
VIGSREFTEHILSVETGTAVPHVSASQIKSFKFRLPPLPEQRAIAHILGTLDDKIELNRPMTETLEAMARALFKSWFVDFDPVRAKAEGRDPGLPQAVADLFPDALDDDDKPLGWSFEPLDQVAEFLNGLALQKHPPEGGNSLPVIKIAELRAGVTTKSDRASSNIPVQYIVNDGDVLFSWSGSLTHLIWSGGRGALNQHLFKVTSERFPKWFYYLWIEHHMPSFRAIAAAKATTMGHIQRHHLTEATTVVPSSTVMEAADRIIAPLVERMMTSDQERRTLAALRDTLLPRLISGELRVHDAERMVEHAV